MFGVVEIEVQLMPAPGQIELSLCLRFSPIRPIECDESIRDDQLVSVVGADMKEVNPVCFGKEQSRPMGGLSDSITTPETGRKEVEGAPRPMGWKLDHPVDPLDSAAVCLKSADQASGGQSAGAGSEGASVLSYTPIQREKIHPIIDDLVGRETR